MTPKSRDRNLARVRGLTGAAAGIAFAACGLFAGLAASASKHLLSAAPATTTVTTTQTVSPKRTLQSQAAATTTTQASTPTVTVTQSAPVATSGGS